MNTGYCWCECSYPGIRDTYFVNVETGIAKKSVPETKENVRRLRDASIESDDHSFCFYISFCFFLHCFPLCYCSRVKKLYIKQSPREIDLVKGEIVFVKTRPIKGWVFVETTGSISGYAPFSYLDPILVDGNGNEVSHERSPTSDSIRISMRTRPNVAVNRHS